MYGVKIYNTVYSDVKYMENGTINPNSFSTYKGKVRATFVGIDTDNLKEFDVGNIGNLKKIFFRKKSGFTKGSYSFFHGIDQGFSGVRGANCIFTEIRNNSLFIVCANPNDWEFKLFERCDKIANLKTGYGINVMNSNGVVTYTSNRKPCMGKEKITIIGNLVHSEVRLHKSEERSPKKGSLVYNLFEIDHSRDIKFPNCFIELGVTAVAYSKVYSRIGLKSECLSNYTLAIDNTGLLRFIPTLGYAWGLYPHRDNDPVAASFKVSANQILIME